MADHLQYGQYVALRGKDCKSLSGEKIKPAEAAL